MRNVLVILGVLLLVGLGLWGFTMKSHDSDGEILEQVQDDSKVEINTDLEGFLEIEEDDTNLNNNENAMLNGSNPVVVMETNHGVIKMEIFKDLAPITAQNFLDLVNKGYYDGLTFHRVMNDFMIQGGDPTGTGSGGPGYSIADEFTKELRHDRKGLLSMANSGPNTGGSQFFITLVPTPWLDDAHAIFGEVTEGMEVVEEIGLVQTAGADKPVEDVIMDKVYIQE